MATGRESYEQASKRWADLKLLQEHYKDFSTLLVEVIEDFMGFKCSDIQIDIGDWVANGPQYRMVQAQRGQAKTTITAIYAVWRLIHEPWTRVLIISAGDDMATEISNWIIQIIMGMPELECLRPDRSNGDRSSVEAFDVHYTLKGPEKSPSIKCMGITANVQGKRADILIADDVESTKNSQTATQRARLHHLTLDFVSICSKGDIIWLGTPQSIDSVYNGLPSRGTAIRVWTGRYPTEKELPDYEGFLAPLLLDRLKKNPGLQNGGGPTGQRGQVTDPILLDEDTLTKKEIDQGASYFQLQHMLSTQLKDQERYPLKLGMVRFTDFDTEEMLAPMALTFVRNDQNRIVLPEGFPIKDRAWRVQEVAEFAPLQGWHMYVDPTGGGTNGDEVAYGITGFVAGRVFLADAGGRPGGYNEDVLDWLTKVVIKWRPKVISIEKNYGNGAFAAAWLPSLKASIDSHNRDKPLKHVKHPGIEEVWESGQKELRIIDTLEPMIGAGKFVIAEELIQKDWQNCQSYPSDLRSTFSLFWQLARITRDKGSLLHDDRLDAVAGAARYWVEHLSIDDEKAKAAARKEAWKKMVKDPLGNGRIIPGLNDQSLSPNALTKVGLGTVGKLQAIRKNWAMNRRF